jgi:hypothetical protein
MKKIRLCQDQEKHGWSQCSCNYHLIGIGDGILNEAHSRGRKRLDTYWHDGLEAVQWNRQGKTK